MSTRGPGGVMRDFLPAIWARRHARAASSGRSARAARRSRWEQIARIGGRDSASARPVLARPAGGQATFQRLAVSPDEAAELLGVSRDYLDEHVIPELRVCATRAPHPHRGRRAPTAGSTGARRAARSGEAEDGSACRSRLLQVRVEQRCGLVCVARHQVAGAVLRDRDRRVAEVRCERFGVHARSDHERGVGVPGLMKADRGGVGCRHARRARAFTVGGLNGLEGDRPKTSPACDPTAST